MDRLPALPTRRWWSRAGNRYPEQRPPAAGLGSLQGRRRTVLAVFLAVVIAVQAVGLPSAGPDLDAEASLFAKIVYGRDPAPWIDWPVPVVEPQPGTVDPFLAFADSRVPDAPSPESTGRAGAGHQSRSEAGSLSRTPLARSPSRPPATTPYTGVSFPSSWAFTRSFEVADAATTLVPLFQAPDLPFPERRALSNPTSEGSPLVFLVRENAGEWLHVQIPRRPNGAMAWVRRPDVTLRTVPFHIVVDVSDRTLTLLHGTDVVRQATVAVGSPRYPTPLGDFYIDAARFLGTAYPFYGVAQLSISGFSNVLSTFAGGVGQIALHGTDQPSRIGEAVSHGCVRLGEADLLALVDEVDTGTPVSIVP